MAGRWCAAFDSTTLGMLCYVEELLRMHVAHGQRQLGVPWKAKRQVWEAI